MTVKCSNEQNRTVRHGAVGVLEQGNKYLMIKRAMGVIKGGTWCFPGGHLEAGETSAQAVTREFAEELGVTVRPLLQMGSINVPDTNHRLAIWRVEHIDGEYKPDPREIADLRWVDAEGIRTICPTLPSNYDVLLMLGYR